MQPFSLNIKGRLTEFHTPLVMGVLNCTPDSFHASSRVAPGADAAVRAAKMVEAGATIIDVGACSTRPGYTPIDDDTEAQRLFPALAVIREKCPEALISVDTYSAKIAERAIKEYNVDIINDISAMADPQMIDVISHCGVPYVLTHNHFSALGTSADAAARCLRDLAADVERLHMAGVADIIVDPGFGFGKTVEENYAILSALDTFGVFGCPILVGVSRKSMITKLMHISADDALPATAMLNLAALQRGASIIRVHDVAEGVQAVTIDSQLSALNSL